MQRSTVNLKDFQWKSMCWDIHHPTPSHLPTHPWKTWSLEERILMEFSLARIWASRLHFLSWGMIIVSIQRGPAGVTAYQRSPRSAKYRLRIRVNLTSKGLPTQKPDVVPDRVEPSASLREILRVLEKSSFRKAAVCRIRLCCQLFCERIHCRWLPHCLMLLQASALS